MKQGQAGFLSAAIIAVAIAALGLTSVMAWQVYRTHRGQRQVAHTSSSQQKARTPGAAPHSLDLAAICADPTQLASNSACAYYDLPQGVASTAGHNRIEIKELGIQMTVPDAIKGSTYAMIRYPGNVSDPRVRTFASLTLRQCSLGALARGEGQATETDVSGSDNSYGILVKQFPAAFIAYTHPQAACGQTRGEVVQHINDLATLQYSLSSITPLP